MADLGRLAFLDRDGDVDTVAVQRAHRRGDVDGVFATIVVLAAQFLGHAVQAQAIEGAAFGQSDVGQALEQLVGLDVLVAGDGQLVDRRTFLDGHHQDAALAIQLHVFEETGLVQGADGLADLAVCDCLAALDRQVGEHRTGADALQAVDADVADSEGLGCLGQGGSAGDGGEGEGQQAAIGESRHVTSGRKVDFIGKGCRRCRRQKHGKVHRGTRPRMSL
ncbi:hypothetical protein D3C73_1180880 [compost metagenome]